VGERPSLLEQLGEGSGLKGVGKVNMERARPAAGEVQLPPLLLIHLSGCLKPASGVTPHF